MQQINLFLEEFRKTEPEFSASIIGILNLYVLGIGLIVFFILLLMSRIQLQNQETLKQEKLYWDDQLGVSIHKYPEPKKDQFLIDRIELYEKKHIKNKNILAYLKNKELDGQGVKFSRILNALTKVNSDDSWLTKLRIIESGKNIELTGYSIEANGLPAYIEKLSNIKDLKNFEFESFDINRSGEHLGFKIGSQREGGANEGILEKTSSQN